MRTPLSRIEISKASLVNNIKQLKNLAKNGTKFSMAIKGNAYGHGEKEIVKTLEPYVDYFQVDSIEELEVLRKVSKKKAFVFGYLQREDLPHAMNLGCIIAPFSISELKEINKIAQKSKKIQEIHIPIDAHLGREGFLVKDLPYLLKEIKILKNIKLSGLYAHFANIEDTKNFVHAQKQIDEYEKAINLIRDFGFKNFQTHISSTAGLLIYEKNKGIHPVIRLGMGVYGMWPREDIKYTYGRKLTLKPVLSWKTKIAQIKILEKGESIGYGLTYITKKQTKVAIIPQGYADGFDRGLSNKGEVLIRGNRCKILGRVMMNMFVVDLSYLKGVKLEDEVVLIGKQGKEEIRAEEIALKLNTINYEITARISSLLPRILV